MVVFDEIPTIMKISSNWLKEYCDKIKEDLWDVDLFIDQISIMKQDHQEWIGFTAKWKTKMIISGNDFDGTWEFVKAYFNVVDSRNSNDKEENDN